MLLPTTANAVLIALVLSLIGWGSWAVMFKATRKSRFELFYYDFALGALLFSVIFAFTLGQWNSKELTFQDNFILTGLRPIAWALVSGIIFTIANLMLLASVAVSGMAIAFPIAFSVAWAVGAGLQWYREPGVNPMLAFGGGLVALVAALLAAIAFSWQQTALSDMNKAVDTDTRIKPALSARNRIVKGIALALIAGVFFSGFFPTMEFAVFGFNPLGPYGAVLLICVAMFGASIVIVPFFLNFPVQGGPLQVRRYFGISILHHVLGWLAGLLWVIGVLAGLSTLNAPLASQPAAVVAYVLSHAAPLLAVVWGVFAWREFAGASTRVNMMLAAMFILLLAGLGMIGMAQPMAGVN